MQRYAPPLIGAAALGLLVSLPAAPAVQPGAPTAEEIERLIADLEAPLFRTREKATAQLLALEERAVAPLHRAAAAGKSLEQVARARSLLGKLAIFEPGGHPVAGLRLILRADRERVKVGETLTLTTTLCNMTHGDLNVIVGYTTSPHCFAAGGALHRLVPAADGTGPPAEQGVISRHFGLCGNGIFGIRRTVPARGAVTYRTTATLLRQNGDTCYHLSNDVPAYLKVPAEGEHTLRMVFEAAAFDPLSPAAWANLPTVPEVEPANEKVRFWGGTVRSNDVSVRVVP